MNPEPNLVVYALVEASRRVHLLHQIAKRNGAFIGCSIYYFEHWVELLTNLSATSDEHLPTLIALDAQAIRTGSLNGLGYLRNSHRLRTIPTLLLECRTRSATSAMAFA